MTKALMYELHQTTLVNNENFNFKLDYATKTREQYLQQIEASTDINQQSQLKRKIASVFEPNTAYDLLTSCCFLGVVDKCYRVKPLRDITLQEADKANLLRQVQAVYGSKVTITGNTMPTSET